MTNGNDIINPHYVDYGADDRGYTHDGLTKREYFAAMAMQGQLANPNNSADIETYAFVSVKQADALINELNKQP